MKSELLETAREVHATNRDLLVLARYQMALNVAAKDALGYVMRRVENECPELAKELNAWLNARFTEARKEVEKP